MKIIFINLNLHVLTDRRNSYAVISKLLIVININTIFFIDNKLLIIVKDYFKTFIIFINNIN